MKFKYFLLMALLMFIVTSSAAMAAVVVNNNGVSLTVPNADATPNGMKFLMNKDTNILAFYSQAVNLTNATLQDENHTFIAQTDIWEVSGSTVLLNFTTPVAVKANYIYYVISETCVGGAGQICDNYATGTSYPYVNTDLSWTSAWYQSTGDRTNVVSIFSRIYTENGTAPASTNFSVNASAISGSSHYIDTFAAIVNGTAYNTTDGVAETNIVLGSGNIDITIENASNANGLFFNKTETGVSTAATYNVEDLYQVEANILSFEFITNNSIFSPLRLNSTSMLITGQDTTDTLELMAELFDIKAYNDTYFNKTISYTFPALFNGTVNVQDLFTTWINLKAINGYTAASINTFNGYTFNLDESISNLFYNTTDGNAEIPAIIGNYTSFAEASGFATMDEYNIYNFSITPGLKVFNYTFSLYTNNSIEFAIFDATTFNLINTTTINISMVAVNKTYNFNTSTGSLYVDGIFDGTYTTTFNSVSYDSSQIFITMTNNSYQLQNVYLGGGASTKTFYVKNNLGENIENATATFTTDVNGTQVVIAQEITDFAGIFQVNLNPTKWYAITVTHADYKTWTGNVKPSQTIYNINMEALGGTNFVSIYEDIKYVTSMMHPANSTYAEFSFNVLSNIGSLQFYGLSYNSTVLSNQTGSTGGGTETINVTGLNPLSETMIITYWFKSTNQSQLATWQQTWLISDVIPTNATLTGGLMDDLSTADAGTQVLLGMGIILVLIVLGGLLTATLVGASIAGMVGVGISAYAGLFPLPISIVALVILSTMLLADALGGGLR